MKNSKISLIEIKRYLKKKGLDIIQKKIIQKKMIGVLYPEQSYLAYL